MRISRYLVVRIVAISVAILVASLALAVWRAQFDVEREEIGATEVVRLFERLYALENGPRKDVQANLEALERINSAGNLRHVQLDLRDALGHALVTPSAGEPASLLQRAFALLAPGLQPKQSESSGPWSLQRDDGMLYVATLTLNPASEQQEALDNLVGMLGVLAGYGVVMLLAVYWTLRKALAPLKPILGAIDRYERNDFTGRLPGQPFKEMDTIARALNHLAASLERTQQARRTLSLKLVSSQEDERMRIARELHDEFGQALTALRAAAAWLGRKVTADPETGAVVAGIAAHCERMHLDIRSLLGRLRPYDRGEGGDVSLGRLLGDLVRSWNDRPGQATRFRLDYEPRDMRLPNELALGIYRLTQEALTNSVRHAQATQTSVTLRAHPDGSVDWSVQDDGVGIEEVDAGMQRGNGLAGMRERAWALGGEIELTRAREHPSRPGLRLSARFARPAGG